MNHISGKVIVITGAASGFGKLIATKTAAMGAKVVASDINEEALTATAAEITDAGGDALAVTSDVTNVDDMRGLVDAAVEKFGAVDVLVNNAGIMPLAFFSDHKEAAGAWHKCIDINLKGALNGIMAAYDQMTAQGKGHIVNISSIYANHPVQGAAVYGATKAALVFLSESLRQEANGRIKVTTVRPTGVPSTGIAGAVLNAEAPVGILGHNFPAQIERLTQMAEGKAPAAWTDEDNVNYAPLGTEHLVDQVIYAINQPWGVCIGDVTVRATGDLFVI